MNWETQEYKMGYAAFIAGSQRHSWESPQWQHGWNDAAAKQAAVRALHQKVKP